MGFVIMRVHPEFASMGVSKTLEVNKDSFHTSTEKPMYRLGFGQSPFPVPEPMLEAYREAMTQTEYLPVQGYLPLREAIADHYSKRDGREVSADCVIVGPGSKELLFLLQFVAHETNVYQVGPAWVSYRAHGRLLGRPIETLATRYEDDWMLTDDTIAPLGEDPSESKVLIVNSPNNPTGKAYSGEWMEWLAGYLRNHQVTAVADEIYEHLQFRGEFHSLAKFYPEGTVISSGISKSCGAGGWRMGYMVFPPELRGVCQAMANVASETYSSAPSPVQHASVVLFRQPERFGNYWRRCRSVLRAMSEAVVKKLREKGVDCVMPDGSWYIMPRFESKRTELAKQGIHTSDDLAKYMREEWGIWTIAGTSFSSEELVVRVCLVDFDGKRAIENIPEEYNEAWFREYGGNLGRLLLGGTQVPLKM